LLDLSREIRQIWQQEPIKFDCNVSENEISFYIVDLNNKNNELKYTFPESRSRGFKWFLSYYITLKYLEKIHNNFILILDDPAVYLHPRGQRDFLKKLEELSDKGWIFYNTHLVSLFNEDELQRIYLIEKIEFHDRKITKIFSPWKNTGKDLIEPIRLSLGIDQLIFKDNLNKIIFVEGISDKFILEGLKHFIKELNDWYIYPISGVKDKYDLEKEKIVNLIDKISCLLNKNGNKYIFIVDGDAKKKINNSGINEKIKFIGNDSQEIEDLIDINLYLDCVKECYEIIFLHDLEKIKKINKCIEKIRENHRGKEPQKITKIINDEFCKALNKGNKEKCFNKLEISKLIKRKIKRRYVKKAKFGKLITEIQNALKTRNN